MEGTTVDELHGRLLKDTFGSRRLSDSDAFLVFVLFHSNRVVLSAPLLTDRPGVHAVAALTQWGVSRSLATLWTGTESNKADHNYWHLRWNGEWGSYRHAESLSPDELNRLGELKAALERHPFVAWFEPED